METDYVQDEVYKGINFSQKSLPATEFEACEFLDCNFSKVNLENITFIDCTFADCNFSNAQLKNTGFKTAHFKNCKLIGLRFDLCNPFLLVLNFNDCILTYASFYKLSIKESRFIKCNLENADFTLADVSKGTFEDSNLKNAVFDQTNLTESNFRTAINFRIDPELNKIRGASFSKDNLEGLLDKYQIKIK